MHYEFQQVFDNIFQLPTWAPQPASDVYVEQASLRIINHDKEADSHYLHNLPKQTGTYSETDKLKMWVVDDLKSFEY